MSRQHLARLFRRHVGISTRMFARVIRMQSLRERVGRSNPVDWSAAALDSGYYDQAHMIAEYRSLTGLTPCELAQSQLDFFGMFHSSNTSGAACAIMSRRRASGLR
ncbi:MAG: AraC family transcriptional regulator [Fuerstiella sp.]|nr:AraC family transcriptional regulator [Fuerstiella sp.]MCP4858536.1 AraC family transcriptional regulator [Fuerstiella sp.]